MKFLPTLLATAALLATAVAQAQTKWDLPAAYPASNFHTINLSEFAADVDKATGVVESYMSSGSTGWDSKTYEHLKYWYDTQAWLPKNVVLVNRAAFTALDKATQDAVLKAGADAEARGLAASKKANGETLEKLKGAGMQILPPSAQLKADMKKVGDTMLKEWLDKAGPEGKQLVDAYQK